MCRMDPLGGRSRILSCCVSDRNIVSKIKPIIIVLICRSDSETPTIHIYDGQGINVPLHTIDKLHTKPVCQMKYSPTLEIVISTDKAGIVEYWTGPKADYKFPERVVKFESKLDTNLYEFAKNKTLVTGLCISNDGKKFATISTDRKVPKSSGYISKLKIINSIYMILGASL